MRLLHTGNDHGFEGAPRAQSIADARRSARRARREPLPLHRLRENLRGRDAGGERWEVGGEANMAQVTKVREKETQGEYRNVGKPVKRLDGVGKVTGETIYADDMQLPRMLHAKVLGSPYAHARIKSIDA